MPKQFLLIFFCLAAAASVFSQTPTIGPGVSHELAIWRAAHYSDVRYKLNLTLEKMSPVLKGTIEIRVKVGTRTPLSATPATAGELPPIILDWRKLAGHEKDSTITNVTVNGAARSPRFSGQPAKGGTPNGYEERSEHLIFTDGVRPGENVIKLDFTSPILTSGSAITRYVDKEDGAEYIYSLFVPSDASTAFPVFDQPDLKARFELILQTPASWNAISNTDIKMTVLEHVTYIPVERLNRGFIPMRSFLFDETKPISTYVFTFAAGPWQQVSVPGAVATGSNGTKNPVAIAPGSDRTPISIFVRKSQAAKFQPHAAEVFRLTREGIKYLETYFDYKFPFPKYDIVLIPEFPFGGMEHAGATFLRESSVIFPTEPTKNDYISRATLIFHETAHQWFGDTVTMKWFDDLWLKEGFANFMAYKTLEKVMPEANAWKVFYERIKQPAYATDSTKGTTPIYQPIENLSAAKSAYGNIVYNKAPAFLRQAEFYLGEDKFQTAVRAFLKKHEFGNAGWEDLVKEFQQFGIREPLDPPPADGQLYIEKERARILRWATMWVNRPGVPKIESWITSTSNAASIIETGTIVGPNWDLPFASKIIWRTADGTELNDPIHFDSPGTKYQIIFGSKYGPVLFAFTNYGDYGYGIFLLDDKSRDYVLKNIQNEKDDFLRTMMWGSLWDSVREGELDPREYVELALRNLPAEKDESITASVLGRVTTAVNYYLTDADRVAVTHPLEDLLIKEMQDASSMGRQITFYRSFLNVGASIRARDVYKQVLRGKFWPKSSRIGGGLVIPSDEIPLKTKDRFDIVTRLIILGDRDGLKLLADLEKSETSDDAKRYAYAARAGIPTAENKAKYWNDFVNNKEISESWIEAAFGPWNSIRQSDLTLPYLERALKELPDHKRNRKIFFVNGWLGAFIGGQRSEEALAIVNKFLADNPSLDNDLRLKVLENVDLIERAVRIRAKYVKI